MLTVATRLQWRICCCFASPHTLCKSLAHPQAIDDDIKLSIISTVDIKWLISLTCRLHRRLQHFFTRQTLRVNHLHGRRWHCSGMMTFLNYRPSDMSKKASRMMFNKYPQLLQKWRGLSSGDDKCWGFHALYRVKREKKYCRKGRAAKNAIKHTRRVEREKSQIILLN